MFRLFGLLLLLAVLVACDPPATTPLDPLPDTAVQCLLQRDGTLVAFAITTTAPRQEVRLRVDSNGPLAAPTELGCTGSAGGMNCALGDFTAGDTLEFDVRAPEPLRARVTGFTAGEIRSFENVCELTR